MVFNGHRSYIGLFLLYAILSCSFLAPIASNIAVPTTLDLWTDTNLLVQAELALKENQFPIRVAPSQHNGMGYPEFQFHSPLLFTIAAYTYRILTPANPFLALKITIWLSLLIVGIYTYRLAVQLTHDSIAAALAGAAYMASPYLLINILDRGDVAEATGQCILPIILYYSFQLYLEKKNSINNMCITGLMWSALAMVYLITFVHTSIILGLFFFFLRTEARFKKLLLTGLAYFFGFLLAAWYLVPIIIYHSSLYISDTLTDPGYYNYFTLAPRLSSLVSPSIFSILSYARNGYDTILSPPFYPSIGLVIMFAVGLCAYVVWINPKRFKIVNKPLIALLLNMFFFTFLISWSPFSWNFLPKFLVIEQFSYRFVAQMIWIGILLVAIAIKIVTNGKNPMQTLIMGLIIICFSSGSWLMIKYEHATPISSIISGSLLDYLNVFLMKPSQKLSKEVSIEPLIMDHATVRSHCNKINDKLNCQLSSPTGGLFELPVIFYPDLLSMQVDGKKASYLPIRFEDSYLAGLKLSSGVHNIMIKFTGLAWANWLSLTAWFILIVMGFFHLVYSLFNKPRFVNKLVT